MNDRDLVVRATRERNGRDWGRGSSKTGGTNGVLQDKDALSPILLHAAQAIAVLGGLAACNKYVHHARQNEQTDDKRDHQFNKRNTRLTATLVHGRTLI